MHNKIIKKAFTLIEAMIAMTIVAILSGIIISGMSEATQSANIAKGKTFSLSLVSSLAANLVSEWEMDRIVTSQTPDTWSKNNCTLGGTTLPALQTDGCIDGNCFSFDGSTSYLDCGNDTSLQIIGDQTIEMWLLPSDLTLRRNPYNKAYGGEGTITQEIGGTFNYYWGTSGLNALPYQGVGGGFTVKSGNWYHIAVVRNLSASTKTVRWFFNGKLTSTVTASYASATASAMNLLIGKGYTSPYSGRIDTVRVYKGAEDFSEIKEHYYAGLNRLLAKKEITREDYFEKIGTFIGENKPLLTNSY